MSLVIPQLQRLILLALEEGPRRSQALRLELRASSGSWSTALGELARQGLVCRPKWGFLALGVMSKPAVAQDVLLALPMERLEDCEGPDAEPPASHCYLIDQIWDRDCDDTLETP